jgi:hypothetical protein
MAWMVDEPDGGDALALPLALVRLMGSAGGALFVAELLRREVGDGGWQAFSYAQWEATAGLSAYRVKKHTAWCVALGVIAVQTGEDRGVAVTFYRLRMGALYGLLGAMLAAGGGEAGVSGARQAEAWRRTVAGG